MITIEHDNPGYIVCRASGTLTKGDYEAAVPELDQALSLRPAPHRLLIRLEDFHGWEIEALWADIRLDLNYWRAFDRIAVVGESGLEKWLTALSKPFVGAEVRYFDRAELGPAGDWLAR